MEPENYFTSNKLIESAWYLLFPFINDLDVSLKVIKDNELNVYPLNKNEALEAFYSGQYKEPVFNKYGEKIEGKFKYYPPCFSKKMLDEHLHHFETYYYRSNNNSFASTGFGSSKTVCDKMPFYSELLIDNKRIKYKNKLMLLCFDVDAKNGELDGKSVVDLILNEFPGSYYERSTHGKGFHIYLKISYSCSHSLVKLVFKYILNELNNNCEFNNFDTNIDLIGGFPSTFYDNKIKRSHCIKIPMINSKEKVLSFASAPIILFNYYLNKHREKIQIEKDTALTEKGKAKRTPRNNNKEEQQEKNVRVVCHLLQNRSKKSLEEEIKELKNILDPHAKKAKFTGKMVWRYGKRVSPEKVNEKYEEYNLNHTTGEKSRKRRIEEFSRLLLYWQDKDVYPYFTELFRKKFLKIKQKVKELNLPSIFYQGKKKLNIKESVYILMYLWYQEKTGPLSLNLSKAIAKELGFTISRHTFYFVRKALAASGAIQKTSNYIPQVRATGFTTEVEEKCAKIA